MPQPLLLPLRDYQRIYQVIYSTLDASEVAVTHRSCIFFAVAGTLILRERYNLPATISAGCLALMVDEPNSNIAIYGRHEDDAVVSDEDAFHAWVECDGWLVDFMAPIMGIALHEDGHKFNVPRRMLQKRLSERKASPDEIQRMGEFFVWHDRSLTESLIDRQSVLFSDLLKVCTAWFRRPPKPLRDMAMADNHGAVQRLVLRAPSIDGVW